ncbi:MAG: ABC transporter substrate-binding protein [Rhodospirillaceae bacterium]|nr:ABC transporter substrate-binding protein [Rhodospirillaceae bacterium]
MKRLLAAAMLAAATAMPAAAQDTIKIGVITDKTGTAKFYADPTTQGTIFAAKVINAAGGVLGKKIELLIEDDQNKPDVSATVARKLVDAGVVFIMSESSTTCTQQQQTVSLETKTPQMTPTNSGESLTTQINNPYFFQTGPLFSYQINTLIAYTRSRNYKRVALMTDNSELGQLVAKSFKVGLEKSGIQVVVEEVVPRGATSAVPQMQKVRAAKPEAIFQAGVLGAEMVLFFRAYHQLGMKTPILGSYNLSIPLYLKMAKGLMNGLTFVDAYDRDKPEVKSFEAAWQKEYGQPPFNLNAYGYDGLMLIADAIKRAGSLDKEKIRAAMQATSGFTATIGAKGMKYTFPPGKRTGFDPNGVVVRLIENDQHGRVVFAGQK